MVFQSPVLFPWRNVLGNVLLPVDVQRLGRERMTRRASTSSPWSASPASSTAIRGSSPAACSSASRWCAR